MAAALARTAKGGAADAAASEVPRLAAERLLQLYAAKAPAKLPLLRAALEAMQQPAKK